MSDRESFKDHFEITEVLCNYTRNKSVEESISQLNDDRRHLVRAEVSSILRRAKPPPKNIQKDVFNALIALKKDPDRLVLSADKGNCVVVMDKQQYDDKALSLLSDKSTYVRSTFSANDNEWESKLS